MLNHYTKIVVIVMVVIAVLVVIGVAFAVVIYGTRVHEIAGRRIRRRKPLRHVEHNFVSVGSLNQLTHRFEDDEDVVYWADRQHWIVYLPTVIVCALVSLLFFIVAAVLATRLGPIHITWGHKPVHHLRTSVTAWLWLLPLLAGMLLLWFPWNLSLLWRAFIRSITNKNSRVDVQPWPWAWWLWNDEKHDPQPLHRIERVEEETTILGRVFGYGTIRVVTLLQEDQDETPHVWAFVRDYEEVAERLRELSQEAKTQVTRAATPASDKSQGVVQLVEFWKANPN